MKGIHHTTGKKVSKILRQAHQYLQNQTNALFKYKTLNYGNETQFYQCLFKNVQQK